MKNSLLLVLLFACSVSLNAQELDSKVLDDAKLMVVYKLTYHEDSTQIESENKEKMLLLIGNEASVFKSYNHYRLNQIVRQKRQDGTLDAWRKSGEGMRYMSKLLYSVYKNYPKGMITTTDAIQMTDHWCIYEEGMGGFQWEMQDDRTEIIGFQVQKAICNYGGRTWEAWFAEELPFDDGPWKFHGLPGLILQVADTQGHYRFELVSVEVPEEGTKVEFEEQDYTKTTKEAFLSVVSKDTDNIVDEVMGSITANGSEDAMRRRIYEILKSKNNPIELEWK